MTTINDRVDGISASVAIKAPVRAATTANITLSGTQTIDGIALVAGDRVLVKNQTDTTENGIYTVQATAWTRSKDFDGARDAVAGTMVWIAAGDTYAGDYWQLTTADPVVIGTSEITFAQSSIQDSVDAAAASATAAAESASGISDLVALAKTDGNFIVGDGLNWVAESGAAARASLGSTPVGDAVFIAADAPTARTAMGVDIPQNSKSADYTLVLGDAFKHILHPAADTNDRTFTIPANASVAFPVGTAVTFVNEVNTVTIAITSDTLVLAGAGTTGSRTLAANGMATAIKITSTKWMISGTGLS